MLLAVEGGGFFSSSANGYSAGLAHLLWRPKNKEKPMRVLPWNQYQLVVQYPESDLQLASVKKHLSCRCASFVCFHSCSAGLEVPSPLKVDPAQQQDVITELPASGNGRDDLTHVEDKSNATEATLKSRLKKPSNSTPISTEAIKEPGEKDCDIPDLTERRKVQWTDACGKELVEIREFEPSCIWLLLLLLLRMEMLIRACLELDAIWLSLMIFCSEVDGSDDEFENGIKKRCSCSIM